MRGWLRDEFAEAEIVLTHGVLEAGNEYSVLVDLFDVSNGTWVSDSDRVPAEVWFSQVDVQDLTTATTTEECEWGLAGRSGEKFEG